MNYSQENKRLLAEYRKNPSAELEGRIITLNRRLIGYEVERFFRKNPKFWYGFEDMVSEGNIIALRVIRAFDPDKGNNLSPMLVKSLRNRFLYLLEGWRGCESLDALEQWELDRALSYEPEYDDPLKRTFLDEFNSILKDITRSEFYNSKLVYSTFRKYLHGDSLEKIAKKEGVTRQAIDSRCGRVIKAISTHPKAKEMYTKCTGLIPTKIRNKRGGRGRRRCMI